MSCLAALVLEPELRLDDVEYRLAESLHQALAVDGTNPSDHARAEVLLDPLERLGSLLEIHRPCANHRRLPRLRPCDALGPVRGRVLCDRRRGLVAAQLDQLGRTRSAVHELHALPFGLAPVPLSPWYAEVPRPSGLLLGITNLFERRLPSDCARLTELISRYG